MNRDNKFRIIFKFAIGSVIAEQEIDIGLIQDITNSYTISKTSAGMPTQPAQNTFVMDMGVSRTYTFQFRRVCPENPVNQLGTVSNGVYIPSDPKKWSNGFWVYIMKRFLVNKWQMETDGCKIRYYSDPEDGELETEFYPKLATTNAYISKFTPAQSVGDTRSLSGNITFTIGATNILKEVANHLIIYDANYVTFNPNATEDNTNLVKVTQNDRINTIGVPTDWTNRAILEWDIDIDNFGWCKDKDGNGEIYSPDEEISLTDTETVLYAIWNRESITGSEDEEQT